MPFYEVPRMDDGQLEEEVIERVAEYLNKLGNFDSIEPSEYDLFQLGHYDQETGNITMLEPKRHIINCLQLVEKETYEIKEREMEANESF